MRWMRVAVMSVVFAAVVGGAWGQGRTWHSFEEALSRADTSGRPVLVDVWAPWCGWCHRMKRNVYPTLPDSLINDVVLTRLNRDDEETRYRYRGRRRSPRQLAQQLGVGGVPAIVFLAPDGSKLFQTQGFLRAEQLRPVLAYVSTGAYRRMSYRAFRKRSAGSS